MKIIQDGLEIRIKFADKINRATLTLPEPYDNGVIDVEATEFSVDIDPIGISLEIGQQVHLTANPDTRPWHVLPN